MHSTAGTVLVCLDTSVIRYSIIMLISKSDQQLRSLVIFLRGHSPDLSEKESVDIKQVRGVMVVLSSRAWCTRL